MPEESCEVMWTTHHKDHTGEYGRRHACVFPAGHAGRIHYCAGCGTKTWRETTDGDR